MNAPLTRLAWHDGPPMPVADTQPEAVDLRRYARHLTEHGLPAVLVEISEARGSVPRGIGTRMLVSAQHVVGTIGGGHLEWQAIAQARRLLGPPPAARHRVHYPLGPALGQCCGGALTLDFEGLTAGHLEAWPRPAPLFTLQMHGAGHVGQAIARLLAGIDCEVDWIDERDAPVGPGLLDGRPTTGWPAHIRCTTVDAVEAEVDQAPVGACYLVLTHRHDLDLRITERILRRNDFAFLGLIGSQTKGARFVHEFRRRGLPEPAIARLTCPIGVPGIEGKEPAVIAVAVVAQLLQEGAAARPSPLPSRGRPLRP